MDYYMQRNMSDYLIHHGIKGQKWGVRRFQDYDGKRIKKSDDDKPKDHSNVKKAVKIGAIAVASALAVYGGYKLYESGAINNLVNGGTQKVSDILGIDAEPSSSINVPSIQEMHDASTGVNTLKSKTNCGSCSVSVIMNLSGGAKVTALSEVPEHMRIDNGNGYDPDKLIECFENAKWSPAEGINRKRKCDFMEKELLSYGEGARGILYTEKLLDKPHGHYFSWCVSGNRVNIIESQPPSVQQTGKVWNTDLYEDVVRVFDPDARIRFARLDTDGVVKIKEGREKDLFNMP